MMAIRRLATVFCLLLLGTSYLADVESCEDLTHTLAIQPSAVDEDSPDPTDPKGKVWGGQSLAAILGSTEALCADRSQPPIPSFGLRFVPLLPLTAPRAPPSKTTLS